MNNNAEVPAHLAGLNEQQLEAVRCRDKITFVNAGPGSGKTFLLVSKIIDHLLTADTPQKVVALSYTNTAARQIGERFHKMMELPVACDFFNGTIHSFCFRMMKAFCESCGRRFEYTILDDEELGELARDIQRQPGDLTLQQYKKRLRLISVEDILALFLGMLDEEDFCRYMAGQVTFMAIDEAQDLRSDNYEILDRLLGIIPGLTLFLVGDPRQNIFEFNGGSYKNLDTFLSRHPNQVRDLTVTYRCGKAVVDYVNTFRFSDCENHPLQSRREEDGALAVRKCPDELSEAKEVIDSVKKKGSLTDCAVLSNNLKYLDPFIGELKREKIPYKVFGGRRSVKRHIRFLNHILRILDNENPYSIIKIAQYAGIDIMRDGRKSKSRFFESDLGQLIRSIRDDCAALGFSGLMACVLDRIMRDPRDSEDISRDYDEILGLSRQYQTISDYLMAFVSDKEAFAAFYRKDYADCEIPSDGDFLTVSTIHSAKGLEWDNVFVMGLCEGNFPNPYFCKDKTEAEQREFYNNELKKMYVAATRAKQSLTLTHASTIKRKGFAFSKMPSRFISSL